MAVQKTQKNPNANSLDRAKAAVNYGGTLPVGGSNGEKQLPSNAPKGKSS